MFRDDVEPMVGTLTVGENAAGPVSMCCQKRCCPMA